MDVNPTAGIPPFLLVVFGGTGDLTRRKLVPAFCRLLQDGTVSGGRAAMVAIGRKPFTDDTYRDTLADSLRSAGDPDEAACFEDLRENFYYRHLDFLSDPGGFAALEEDLRAKERDLGNQVGRLYYLAMAPEAFEPIVLELHAQGMLEEAHGFRRVLAEKPFGSDLASARKLQRALVSLVPEDRLYRIDHYLGKEMVQSLLGLRFANRIFEPLWNGGHIDHVQISACETDGVGSRGGYYEKAGALKDMVQSHLLQMLALVAMEPPTSFSADAIRDAKVAALRAVVLPPPSEAGATVVRGQYAAGAEDGRPVVGYREEAHVAPESDIETFAALKVRIATPRWEGVPFYLRAGKRMDRKGTWICVQFQVPQTKSAYPELASTRADRLVVSVQPEEGFFFEVNTMAQAQGFETERVRMDYCRSCRIDYGTPLAYERLLAEAAQGSPALFVRWDELETAWSLVDAIIGSCRGGTAPPEEYPAGSAGPGAAIRLLEDDGRSWWEEGNT